MKVNTTRKRAYIPRWKLPKHRIKTSAQYIDDLDRKLRAEAQRKFTH